MTQIDDGIPGFLKIPQDKRAADWRAYRASHAERGDAWVDPVNVRQAELKALQEAHAARENAKRNAPEVLVDKLEKQLAATDARDHDRIKMLTRLKRSQERKLKAGDDNVPF